MLEPFTTSGWATTSDLVSCKLVPCENSLLGHSKKISKHRAARGAVLIWFIDYLVRSFNNMSSVDTA